MCECKFKAQVRGEVRKCFAYALSSMGCAVFVVHSVNLSLVRFSSLTCLFFCFEVAKIGQESLNFNQSQKRCEGAFQTLCLSTLCCAATSEPSVNVSHVRQFILAYPFFPGYVSLNLNQSPQHCESALHSPRLSAKRWPFFFGAQCEFEPSLRIHLDVSFPLFKNCESIFLLLRSN